MQHLRIYLLSIISLLLFGCAAQPVLQCPSGFQQLPDCPPANAVNDENINNLYTSRTWQPPDKLTFDPVKKAEQAKIPINSARAKVIGPTYTDALKSLAAKIWLIENAQHTVDAMYYIFKPDLVGYAVLGALCNAVQRGVDVRMMVDSLGSLSSSHSELRALETCADKAGFIHNADGQITTKKARVQVVIFNAISKFHFNRRSHDKVLVIDGSFPNKTAVMTGGRNISLDYYGINKDGSRDPTAFRDLEILLRAKQTGDSDEVTVGRMSELYYSMIFLYKANKRLWPNYFEDDTYSKERKKSQESLAFLKNLPDMQKQLQSMSKYMNDGFRHAEVRLSHQLSNLTNPDVTTKVLENIESNPNSILYLISKLFDKAAREGVTSGTLRIVSPYLFSGKYKDKSGKIVHDGAKNILKLLSDNPNIRIEIVTNSVLTSDNFFTQAIIDLDMAPRLLLTPELMEAWRSSLKKAEFNPEVVESEEWKKLVNHPQLFIYQTGKLDSIQIGKGKTYYGKLHAKFIVGERVGFIGTSNFDYRSNLYNNEMGFFYRDPELRQDLVKIFEWLKATSYRWGTPEWLQMRKELMASGSSKAGAARKQRFWFDFVHAFGIEYLM